MNEDKSRTVDLAKGESFGFLGFEFRRVRSRRGVWRPHYTPQIKKRTALLRKLKEIFRRYQSRTVGRVVTIINPILRGWVNYFAIGPFEPVFQLCSPLGREEDTAPHDAGSPTPWIWLEEVEYEVAVRAAGTVRKLRWESAPDRIGHITLDVKQTGKRSAGNPHAAFEEAGTGNVTRGAGLRTNAKVVGATTGPYSRRASPRPYRSLAGRRRGLAAALARAAAKLTQAELARRLGTTQSAVARLEGGRVSPPLATLRRYAEATGTRLTGLERAASPLLTPDRDRHGKRVRTVPVSPRAVREAAPCPHPRRLSRASPRLPGRRRHRHRYLDSPPAYG